MSANLDQFQALLRGMRETFLNELEERCDRLEELILALERSPEDRETFNELYRAVHSLKGSGGTHGLSVLTALCHPLEDFLSAAASRGDFGESFATTALAYADLLRRVEAPARSDNPDYTAIEADLERLRAATLNKRKAGLIAESSAMMARLYQTALARHPVQLTVVDNGLAALERLLHETYDFVIAGRELKELNGVAVVAALRASQGRNHDVPVILVSSNRQIPGGLRIDAVLTRDQQLSANLVTALRPVLG